MTKYEYLSQLKNKLQGFDEEVVEEIMQDYEEHFNLGYAQHKSDEEIIASLGSIDELVKEMEECYKRHQSNGIYVDLSGLNSSLKDLKKGLKEMGQTLKKEFEDVDFNFTIYNDDSSDFNDLEVKDFSDFDDLGVQKFTFTDIQNIVVDSFYGDIEIHHGDTVYVEYECEGSKKSKLMSPLYTKVQGETLTISIESLKTYGHIVKHTPDMRLFIYVPDSVETIKLSNCTAYISIEEISIQNVEAELTNSDIDMRDSRVNNCSLTSYSGDIHLDDCEIDTLKLTTYSGDIEVTDSTFGKATLSSKSGDVSVVEGSSRMIVAGSISGDVEINSSGCEAYSLNTTSGDIRLIVENECAMQVTSISGDIDIELLDSVNGFIAATKTVSGDIAVSFEDLNRNELPSGIYQYSRDREEMEVKMQIKTTSGDITIHE